MGEVRFVSHLNSMKIYFYQNGDTILQNGNFSIFLVNNKELNVKFIDIKFHSLFKIENDWKKDKKNISLTFEIINNNDFYTQYYNIKTNLFRIKIGDYMLENNNKFVSFGVSEDGNNILSNHLFMWEDDLYERSILWHMGKKVYSCNKLFASKIISPNLKYIARKNANSIEILNADLSLFYSRNIDFDFRIDAWSQISRRLCIIEDNGEFCIILDIVYKKVVLRVEAAEEDGEIDLIENCEFLNNNNLVIKTRNQKIFIWNINKKSLKTSYDDIREYDLWKTIWENNSRTNVIGPFHL